MLELVGVADMKALMAPEKSRLAIAAIKKQWSGLTAYERFEHLVSRYVMLLIAGVILYSLIFISITLFKQITQESDFPDTVALKDVFGSILTVLILIEFNHSISLALTKKLGVLQARYVILIALLVIARKAILLDFAVASFETLIGIGAIAVSFGLLYWLIGAPRGDAPIASASPHEGGGP